MNNLSVQKTKIKIGFMGIISLLALASVFVFLLSFAPAEARTVLLPISVMSGTLCLFVYFIYKNNAGVIPVFELGVFYAGVIFLYAAYPLVSFLANGLTFTIWSDGRLLALQPAIDEIVSVAWYYTLYLSVFVITYMIFRKRQANNQPISFQPPAKGVFVVAVIFYFFINLFYFFITIFFQLSKAQSYIESYLIYRGLPLALQQAIAYIGEINFILQLLIFFYLFINYKKYKYFIFGILIFLTYATFISKGTRTPMVLIFISCVIMYHTLVKPFKTKTIIAVILFILALFLFLGMLRGGMDIKETDITSTVFAGNEFEAVFANAIDIFRMKMSVTGSYFSPTSLYLSDILRFIPRQFLPFEKVNLSEWYVNNFYSDYAQKGGGYVFGGIAESIMGFGVFDIIWRAGLLGFIFALVHRRYIFNSKNTFWTFLFYIWITVLSYDCIRNGTFALLPRFLYGFIPSVFLINMFSAVLRRRGK